MPIRGLVVLTFFVLSLPICFVRPFYGVLLWAVVGFLNPQSYLWGSVSFFPWALAVAIPTLVGFPLFCNGWKNLMSNKVMLMAALWGWFTITSVVSTNTGPFAHHSADTWTKYIMVSKVMLMAVMTVAIVDSFRRLRILVMVMSGCFGFFVAKAFPWVIATGGAFRLYGPESSMIADNNDFGLALNMSLPMFFFLSLSESTPWVKWMYRGLCLMTIPAIYFTYSRGALVGLVVVSLLMFLQLKQRLLVLPVIAIAVLFAVMFAPESWKTRMNPDNAMDNSAKQRLNAWAFSRNLAADYPIFGGGFATFTPQLFEIYAPVTRDIKGAHSVYFGVLAEHGVVGLALYLALVFSCLASTLRLTRRARAYGDTLVANYANMLRFSLVAFLTSGMFLGRAYFDYFFSIVACIAILERVAEKHWAEQDEEPEESGGDTEVDEFLLAEGGTA